MTYRWVSRICWWGFGACVRCGAVHGNLAIGSADVAADAVVVTRSGATIDAADAATANDAAGSEGAGFSQAIAGRRLPRLREFRVWKRNKT